METFIKEFEHLKIPFDDIKLATNNFDKTKVIGRGGFGLVYGGELSHSKGRSMVAIKRLDTKLGQGVPEFWEEITILDSHTHKNLVALLGFCIEDREMFLVYEYASNGSLDKHLHSTDFKWTQRLKTCLDTARGISYLHDADVTKKSVIHRDIKSANILVYENWNAKIADMGLSRIVPDNQHYTGHFTNHGGTRGYCDPEYIKTSFLTKMSDVYSFGVVLFEILCGRFCCEYNRDGKLVRSSVPTWKERYKQNKLEEIIFNDLKQQINQKSLETYSNIAFKCLQKSHERPTMQHVVKELETALTYQELHEGPKLTEETKMLLRDADPRNYASETEMKMFLLKGILINGGKTWFSRNTNGEHCEMISIAECLSGPRRHIFSSEHNSRFAVGCYEPFGEGFKTYVKTQFLSPQITYTVNLVLKRKQTKERYLGLEYKLKGDKEKSYSFVAYEREDGWLTAELYQFTNNQETVELEIQFYTKYCDDLVVEGIEFEPLKKGEDEVLRDVNVDMQNKNDICEGSLIKHFGEERFSFYKDGQKCLMLPARAALEENEWKWKPAPETRFKEVADCITKKFSIFCKFSSEMLSPKTTYAVFLVYKSPPDYKDINPPMQLVDKTSDSKDEYNIFLHTPQTPVISWNRKKEKTFKPSSRPEIKSLPKLRSDKWMEVQIYEFHTRPTNKMISMRLRFSNNDTSLEGMTVNGLEFRPI